MSDKSVKQQVDEFMDMLQRTTKPTYVLTQPEAQQQLVADMLAMLKRLEWFGESPFVDNEGEACVFKTCPVCLQQGNAGSVSHLPSCELAALIARAEGKG